MAAPTMVHASNRGHRRACALVLLVAFGIGLAALVPSASAYPCGGGDCPWSGWLPLTFTYEGGVVHPALLPGGEGGRIEALAQLPDGGWALSTQAEPNSRSWTPMARVAERAPLQLMSMYQLRAEETSAFRDARGRIRLYDHYTSSWHGHLNEDVVENVQTATGWTGWQFAPAASMFLPSTSALDADGRLELFGFRGASFYGALHGVMHVWELPGGGWSQPRLLVEQRRDSWAVGHNADGRLQVFAADGSALGSAWQTTPNGTWTSVAPLATGNLWVHATASDADGRMELFCSDLTGALNLWQRAPNATWSAPVAFGPDPQGAGIAVARGATGRLEVFLRDPADGTLISRWQYTPGGAFAPWSPLPGNQEGARVGTNADGHLVLFDGEAWNIQQT